MTTQVQVRGNITSTQEARTLAQRELDVDTTLGRLNVHNGSDAGGIPHLRAQDHQNNTFNSGVVGGSANAITLVLSPSISSYATYQTFKIKVASNNTGSATLNVDSVGAITIKKISSSGLIDLEADDLVQDAMYDMTYNGTNFVVSGSVSGGVTSVSAGTNTVIANMQYASRGNVFQYETNQAGSSGNTLSRTMNSEIFRMYCPVGGSARITGSFIAVGNNTQRLRIQVNGSNVQTYTRTSSGTTSISYDVNFSAGDYVSLYQEAVFVAGNTAPGQALTFSVDSYASNILFMVNESYQSFPYSFQQLTAQTLVL